MTYTVVVKPAVEKAIRKLAKDVQRRVVLAIVALEDDPRPHGVLKLQGSDSYRIRVGDYRVIYDIDDEIVVVTVLRVAHRRDVYRD